MSSENQPPDLASVMKILAGLAQAKNQQQAQPPTQTASPQIPDIRSHASASQLQQWPLPAIPSVMHHQSVPSQAVSQKLVDPATIIDWSAGLRCVMKTVAKHDHVLQEIRKVGLIRSLWSYPIHRGQPWTKQFELTYT